MPAAKRVELGLDLAWVDSILVNDAEVRSTVVSAKFSDKTTIQDNSTQSMLKKAIQCVDLTSLVGNETPEAIKKLCLQAAKPLEDVTEDDALVKTDNGSTLQCAAVCVYPLRVEDAVDGLRELNAEKSISIAAVAAGFPTGQFPLHTRLAEIYYVVSLGVQEVDVVIDRSLVLRGLWQQLFEELRQMRAAAGRTTLKVILSVTECGSWTNVYKAAAVAMMAGADFIKTSTGKEATAMTIHEGLVMCWAIKDFYSRTGVKVGLKPAGGVRTVEQTVSWMLMVQEVLGSEWLNSKLFRIGTSGSSAMIDNIHKALQM